MGLDEKKMLKGASLSEISHQAASTPQQNPADRFKACLVFFIKRGEFGGIHVEHRGQGTRYVIDGYDDLAIRAAVTRDMARKGVDVFDQLGLARGGCRATDAAAKRNAQAAEGALIGPHYQLSRLKGVHNVKARPEKAWAKGLHQKADGGGIAGRVAGLACHDRGNHRLHLAVASGLFEGQIVGGKSFGHGGYLWPARPDCQWRAGKVSVAKAVKIASDLRQGFKPKGAQDRLTRRQGF